MGEDTRSSPFDNDDDRVFEVADILINLKNLIFQSKYFMNLPPLWRGKRKRSALIDSTSSYTVTQSPIIISPKTTIDSAVKRSGDSAVKRSGEVNAPSADSPLLFPSSESDEKSNNHRLRSHKDRRRMDLVEKIEGLSETRDMLRGEVERVTAYHSKLLALNMELKSLRQKVISSRNCQDGMVPQIEKPRKCNFGADLNPGSRIPHQQRLVIQHQTAAVAVDYQAREPFQIIHSQASPQPLISSNNGGWVDSDGNIHVGVDPVQAMGYVLAKRAKYAENRMIRKNKRACAKKMKLKLRLF